MGVGLGERARGSCDRDQQRGDAATLVDQHVVDARRRTGRHRLEPQADARRRRISASGSRAGLAPAPMTSSSTDPGRRFELGDQRRERRRRRPRRSSRRRPRKLRAASPGSSRRGSCRRSGSRRRHRLRWRGGRERREAAPWRQSFARRAFRRKRAVRPSPWRASASASASASLSNVSARTPR